MAAGMFSEIRDPSARVRALCEYGCSVEVDQSIPPKRYYRSGLEMIRMANVYYEEGNWESAFILYSKFITLFVEKLPKHPDYKTSPASDKAINRKKLQQIFPKAEETKTKLTAKYAAEEAKRQAEERKKEALLVKQLEEQQRLEEEERERQTLRRQDEEERLRLEQEEQFRLLQEREKDKLKQQDRVNDAEAAAAVAAAAASMGALDIKSMPPGGTPSHPPPAYGTVYPNRVQPVVPSRDLKPAALVSPSAPPLDNRTPLADRSSKPIDHHTSIGGSSTNKFGLRDVQVPAELTQKFLNLAKRNTDNNVETCGLLCGKLANNAFRITHLVVPKQSGTPDSCDMRNEEEIFAYQDEMDLITLGWIHTHPSQTAFLSSVDLHTHCPYQLMMPEAIAIVCAPKFKEIGYFYLTPDHGLRVISNCNQKGFHMHQKDPPLFEPCSHVKLDHAGTVIVKDLR